MAAEIFKYLTPSGYDAEVKGPIPKTSFTLGREIPYEGYYTGYLKIPHNHIVARQIPKHLRLFIRKKKELNHRRFCFDKSKCETCREICQSTGGCNERHYTLYEAYENTNLIEYFYYGITYGEQEDGYDIIGFDTHHCDDEHIKITDSIPPELIRESYESIKNDYLLRDPTKEYEPFKTVKTKKFVMNCLNLASDHLDKLQKENDEFWQKFVIKIAMCVIKNQEDSE